jgi:hypothetical protein
MKTLATLVCLASTTYCIAKARETHIHYQSNADIHPREVNKNYTPLYTGIAGISFLGATAIQLANRSNNKKSTNTTYK